MLTAKATLRASQRMATERIVGIDLGTTNSLVAYMEGERPVVIPGEDGLNLVPSVVALDENGQIVVGNAARKYLIETPERAVYSVKRLMGRGVEDVQDELKLFPFPPGRRSRAGRSAAHQAGRQDVHAAGDFRVHPAPAEAQRRALFRRAGDARRSSPCPPTSTTRSGRRRRTPDASPDWKCCAW